MKNKFVTLFLIFSIFLNVFSFSQAEDKASSNTLAEVTTEKGSLTIRKEPDSHSKKIGEIKKDTYVYVLESNEDWYLISADGVEGYAMAKFLSIREDINTEIFEYTLLRKGDCNDAVIAVKQRLMELGYFRDNSKLTNRFNDTLEQRIKMFQRQNGCVEDGIATPETQMILFSENAVSNEELLPASPTHYRAKNNQNAPSNSGLKKITCMCCGGDGCSCCDNTGFIWVPTDVE